MDQFNNFFWNWGDYPVLPNVPEVTPLGYHYFGDFLHLITVSSNDPGTIPYWPYFPFSNLFGFPFIDMNYLMAYFLFASIFFLVSYINSLSILKSLTFKDKAILLIYIFSNVGSVYMLDRGNIQLAVTAFISLSIFFLMRSKYTFFAVFIGMAAAIKVWPILFLIILLKRKKFRSFCIGLLTFMGANVVALIILGVAVNDFIDFFSNQILEIRRFNSYKGELWHAGGKNTSLLILLEIFQQNNIFYPVVNYSISNYIYIQLITSFIFFILYLRIRVLNFTLELLLISCFLLVIPTAQYGYSTSIISILIPLLLVNPFLVERNIQYKSFRRIENFIRFDIILVILGIVLVPWTIRIRDLSEDSRYPMDLNSVFSPIGLCILLVVVFWNLQPNLKFRDRPKI